ncbi:hypothetical protein N7582_001559 [Saccharomyces uvarum]|uniref:Transcriptional regulatory protein DOT6 n=1 Tax=Saccharomyces uvarum TaxID=230603 RepID=A0AA35JH46_SACUV|nr:hypothetical protein N7582_001559 [Saccharomyces uvarum]CAI4060193.1 hypothetical protein SUVC_05G1710 [Saccharomyces uvarum]
MSVSTRLNSASIHLSSMSPHPQLHSLSRQPHASMANDEAQESSSSPSLPPSSSSTSSTTSSLAKNSSKNPSSWDPQDDLLLRHLKEVKKMGWKDISQYFPNRTPNACQFRWRRLKSGNLKSNKTALIDINTYSGPVKITNTDGATSSQKTTPQDEDEEDGDNDNDTVEAPAIKNATPSIPIPSRKTSLPSFGASMSFAHSPSNMTPPAIVSNAPSSIPFVPPQLPVAHLHHPHHHLHHHPNHKTLKPRSNSHSFTSSLNQDPVVRFNDEEKYGFIPKVFVRSRRSSFAYPQQAAITTTTPSSPNSSHVLNASLLGSKSRKDSSANWSRRSSFNISSNNTSRRSSIVLAPNSVSNVFNTNNSSSSNTNSRRESVIKKEFQQRLNHLSGSGASTPSNGAIFPASYTFMDLPRLSSVSSSSSSTTLPKFKRGSLSGHLTNPPKSSWSRDEDILLVENKKRNLSMMELSILLPQRTEVEIQWRLSVLSNDADELSPVHSPERTLSKKTRPRMFQTNSTTDNDKDNDNDMRDDDEDDVDPLHRSKRSANKTAFSSSSSNSSSKDVSPDPIFSPDPADDSSNASDSGSRLTIASETSFSNTTDRATSSKHPHDITLLDNFRSEAITLRPKPSSTTTSITTETTCNMMNHSSSTTTTTNNSPLPSINTIFKDML